MDRFSTGFPPEHAFSVGFWPEKHGPRPLIPREEWHEAIEEMNRFAAEEVEWWKGESAVVRLMVELPFWLMIPDCEVSVAHDRATIAAAVRGDYIEVSDGPLCLDSHANVVYIGANEDLKPGKEPPPIVAKTQAPVYRPMKTVVLFRPNALKDALVAWSERGSVTTDDTRRIRRINRVIGYFRSLAYAHIPFLNRLITSYRSTSLDPFAFEVSEWDVPVWYAENDGTLVWIGLMPYWDSDSYPVVRHMHTGERSPFFSTSPEAVQTEVNRDVPPGKLELLDALSLSYRGRFGDAVRSAVTAIEVALEAQLVSLLKKKGYTDEQVQRRLNETRKSFYDRLADYEKLSQKRLPGPMVSWIPYINGVRLRSELDWVRKLRHDVVHEGIRVDVFSRGSMLRAIETMTWLFQWLSWGDLYDPKDNRNYVFYSTIRGQIRYPFVYTDSGVVVLPDQHDTSATKSAEGLLLEQYLSTLRGEKQDIELFTSMSCEFLHLTCEDAPPESAHDPTPRERYHIIHNGRQATAFCLEFDGLIDRAAVGAVALRSLAHMRLRGHDWTTLCIVHHQRHLPAELREIEQAIPEDVTRVAAESGITVITALDLQSLVRGVGEYQWDAEQVKDLLFLPGRQGLLPPGYHWIGAYVRFYERHCVMSVQVDQGQSVKVGDTLGIRLPSRYHEERIESLQVEHEPVPAATGPCKVGIKTGLRKAELRAGQSVFVRT
jgi:hypothetical protein